MAEVGASSRARICSSSLGGGAGCDGFGSDDGVRVAVADDLQVQVVGGPSAGEHGVQLLPGFLPGDQAVHGVGGDALGGMDGGRIARSSTDSAIRADPIWWTRGQAARVAVCWCCSNWTGVIMPMAEWRRFRL